MSHWLLKQKKIIKRAAVYVVMTLAVVIIVTFVVLFVLGFRFDADKGQITQYSFLQFSSSPSGAAVTVDGKIMASKTPDKTSVPAGKHEVIMWRDGYEKWQKSVDLKAGTITWLNYALLIPKQLTVESVSGFTSLYSSLASPEGKSILIQEKVEIPAFNLFDLGSDIVKSTQIVIPANLYSDANIASYGHIFKIAKWDDGGRYVLVGHTWNNQEEWLVLDTQNVASTKNITRLFNISISDINFSGTSGNDFYILSQSDIRKLDLSAETISKPLVSNVTSFGLYKTNIITYVGIDSVDKTKQVAGLYREGDVTSHILRTTNLQDVILHIATTHYFNENYVAISEGNNVDVLSGSYPNNASEDATSLKKIASYTVTEDVQKLSFSPIGEYILTQSGPNFTSYDLEYQTISESKIEGINSNLQLEWLDDNYVWSERDGSLVIREFDGANAHVINVMVPGHDAVLTHNGKYIYSVGQSNTGYQLQRVLMILP